MAERFYCPDFPVNGRVVLSGDEAKHLSRVRRLGPGALVELFNGQSDRSMRAEVVSVGAKDVELVVLEEYTGSHEPPIPLTLASAVPKGDRFDWLVEKAVEVGVSRLVPIRSDRSVVDPRPAKLDRQRRAVIEASKQSGRNRLMEIAEPTTLTRFLEHESAEIRLIAHPTGGPPDRPPRLAPAARTALLIGPEGGWTDQELAQALSLGWVQISLGPTILRIETAAIVGSALVLARF